jgi:polyhydroxyalkanoic acid synthase PhaR subunit
VSTSGERPGGMPDPMAFWSEMYRQAEQSWGKVFEQSMGTESYAQMVGQSLEAYVTFQKSLRDSMNRYLETMNLPSRDDFSRVAAQIVALEAKVDAVDEKLDDIQDRLGGRDDGIEGLRADLKEQRAALDEIREALELRDQRVAEMLDKFVAPQRQRRAKDKG